ncbi:hypothetical protein LCGC14_1091890 [marine sediment metagenome]|uniref:Elp3/MiaA/NifB-like radical SAM core domain-containing protein n=1 Tax=marine sediment metagenome TaxID=412755 RepID=A0A0F9PV89_9ZZZZ|nr:MAG: Radical SAM superfamily protein [Candidatus Lokiarchaeum sp. GC14_75]
MAPFRILYIECIEDFPPTIGLLRISNYLNSKKGFLRENIEEDILILGYENLPPFNFRNITIYRKELKKLLQDTYNKFNFDLVAISCFTSLLYTKSLEIAYTIKNFINPTCITVIGGIHPTVYPEDFNPKKIPQYFYDYYLKKILPVNCVIRGEGEIGFYKLVKSVLNKENALDDYNNSFNVFTSNIIDDLNTVPLIDLSLYEKYKTQIINDKYFNIEASRSCPYGCTFCWSSLKDVKCYNIYRTKASELYLQELCILKKGGWLDSNIVINTGDPIFFPMRRRREKLFEKLNLMKKNLDFTNSIAIFDRINSCSESDLRKYKDLGIWVEFGLENVSIEVLKLMNKTNSKNTESYIMYLNKVKKVIKIANEIDLKYDFTYIFGFPGSTLKEYRDFQNFFLKKNNNKKSLIDKYNVNFSFSLYLALPSRILFDKIYHKRHGTVFFFKKWWRLFDKFSWFYRFLYKPSQDLSLERYISEASNIIKIVSKHYLEKGNPFYCKDNASSSFYDDYFKHFFNRINEFTVQFPELSQA